MILHIRNIALLFLIACGCAVLDRPPGNLDLLTPKSAGLAYLTAVQSGNLAAARGASVGMLRRNGGWMHWSRWSMGWRSFDNALYAKFGQVTYQVHTDMHDSLLLLADQPVLLISNGAVATEGDRASIEPDRKGFTARFQPTIYLLREKSGWRVDLEQTYAGGARPNSLKNCRPAL